MTFKNINYKNSDSTRLQFFGLQNDNTLYKIKDFI